MDCKHAVCADCALTDEIMFEDKTLAVTDQVDILVVGSFPMEDDIEKKMGFVSKKGAIVRNVIGDILKQYPKVSAPTIAYTYAVLCNTKSTGFKASAEVIHKCASNLLSTVDRRNPKVIVATGGDAVKGFGFTETISAMRGGVYNIKTATGVVPLVATYHIAQVDKNPGLLPVFKNDVYKAVCIALGDTLNGEMHLECPVAYEDCVALLARAKAEIQAYSDERTGRPVILAVDTETTSVEPHKAGERMISISLSWDKWQGIAFPVEHRDAGFTEEQWKHLLGMTEDILNMPCVRTVYNNAKFDVKWLRYKYGMKIPNPTMDTMLLEHILEEDKKGEYSLKDITRDRFPTLGKYESELQKELEKVHEQKHTARHAKIEVLKEAKKEETLSWWVSLGKDKRSELLATMVEKGFLTVTDTKDMADVTRRKFKGQIVVPKKYVAAVEKLLKKVPFEAVAEIDPVFSGKLTEFNDKVEALSEKITVTYEEIPIGVLHRYAAIDALTTRLILEEQLERVKEDAKMLKLGQARSKHTIPTKPIMDAYTKITLPLSYVLTDMEYKGITLDRSKTQEYIEVIENSLASLLDKMYTEIGYKFNTSASAPDLSRILYQEMGLPILKTTDGGAPSTDAQTLKELYDSHDNQFLKDILSYRKLDKCLNTYLKNWLRMSADDGRIHCNYNQIGTATYRLSSSNPNLGLRLEVVKLREFSGHPTA